MEIPMNRAKARNEAPRLREVAYSRLRKLEQSLFVKKTDPQACLWIRIARRDQDPQREKSSFHKTSLFQKEIGRLTAVGLFSSSMLDKVQRVVPRHAAAKPTAQQSTRASTATVGVNDPGYKSPIMGNQRYGRPAAAGRRVDREAVWLFPLRPEIHSHNVRACLGSSFTHLIREASLACGAGGINIGPRVRYRRDHNSIAVDVDIV